MANSGRVVKFLGGCDRATVSIADGNRRAS